MAMNLEIGRIEQWASEGTRRGQWFDGMRRGTGGNVEAAASGRLLARARSGAGWRRGNNGVDRCLDWESAAMVDKDAPGGQPRQGGRAQSRVFLVETKKARLKANRGGGCAHRASKKQSWAASLSRLGRLSFSTTPLVIAIMAMHACAHRHSARPAGPGVVALRSAATMLSVLVVVRRRV